MSKRIKMPKLVVLILLVCFVSSFVPKYSIQADAAPVFMGGVNIIPYNENNITLKEENLVINFEKTGTYNDSTASVDAKFVFVNTGDKIFFAGRIPIWIGRKARP